MLLISAVLILLSGILVTFGLNTISPPLIIFTFIFAIIIPLSILFLHPATMGDRVARDERLSCETTWELDENRVWIKNKFIETNFDWGSLGQTYETGEHYLISYTVNKNMFQILPKRAFLTAEQQNEFRQLLEQKTRSITRIRSVNLPEPSRRSVMVFMYGFYSFLAICIIILVVYSFRQAMGR